MARQAEREKEREWVRDKEADEAEREWLRSPYYIYHPPYHNCFTLVSAIHRLYEVFLFANMFLPHILFNIHICSLYMHIFVSAHFPINTLSPPPPHIIYIITTPYSYNLSTLSLLFLSIPIILLLFAFKKIPLSTKTILSRKFLMFDS